MTDTPPPNPYGGSGPNYYTDLHPPKPKKDYRTRFAIGVVVVLFGVVGVLSLSEDDEDQATQPAPTSSTSSPSQAPSPEPAAEPPPDEPEATASDVLAYVSQGAGAATPDEACLNGISWLCAIDYVNPSSGVLEVRVDNTENAEGDAIARNFYNFLTASDDSPMPDVFYVQVTTAADGEVAEHRG